MTTQKAVVEMQWGLRPWHVHTRACVDLARGNWLHVCEAVVPRNWTCVCTRVWGRLGREGPGVCGPELEPQLLLLDPWLMQWAGVGA